MSTSTSLIPRSEILDLGDYEQQRDTIRPRAIEARKRRRVALGPNAMLSFENRETLRYQIHEMLRTERIAKEPEVLHEIETYSELLPSPDSLSATLLIEFPDKDEREVKLVELLGLENYLRVELAGAGAAAAEFDERQIDVARLSSVQFVRFTLNEPQVAAIRSGSRVTVVCDHPKYFYSTALEAGIVAALIEDLDDAKTEG